MPTSAMPKPWPRLTCNVEPLKSSLNAPRHEKGAAMPVHNAALNSFRKQFPQRPYRYFSEAAVIRLRRSL